MRADDAGPRTVPAAFMAAIAEPTRPLLTWYDDDTSERAELSGATLANWVAKTANLLVDGSGLAGPAVAVVDLPPHWQTAAVLLGCWSAGLCVATGRAGAGGAGGDGTSPGGPPEVVFAAADRTARYAGSRAEVFALALAPLAAPLREVPPGVADYVVEVRAYGDHFTPALPVGPGDPAIAPAVSHAELCRAAAARAGELGIRAGDRVLVDLAAHPDPLDWLLAPLLAGASTVLCRNADPARLPGRIATERVAVSLTP